MFMKNWKTTVAGIIVFVVAGCVALGWISSEIGGMIVAAAAGIGLGLAKDHNKTGV